MDYTDDKRIGRTTICHHAAQTHNECGMLHCSKRKPFGDCFPLTKQVVTSIVIKSSDRIKFTEFLRNRRNKITFVLRLENVPVDDGLKWVAGLKTIVGHSSL